MRLFGRRRRPPMVCQEWVELVTDYLEGTLPPDLVERAEAHLAECGPCAEYLAEMRLTVTELGRMPSERLSATARADLLTAYRQWSADQPPGA